MTTLKKGDFEVKNEILLAQIARRKRILTADGYEGFRRILNAQRVRLNMTMSELDTAAGLAEGHCASIFCGNRNLGPISLGNILRALGSNIALLPAAAGKGNPIKISKVCNGSLDKDRRKALALLGWNAKRAKMTPEQWADFCRKGQLASALKRRNKDIRAARLRAAAARRALKVKQDQNGPRQQTDPSTSS